MIFAGPNALKIMTMIFLGIKHSQTDISWSFRAFRGKPGFSFLDCQKIIGLTTFLEPMKDKHLHCTKSEQTLFAKHLSFACEVKSVEHVAKQKTFIASGK